MNSTRDSLIGSVNVARNGHRVFGTIGEVETLSTAVQSEDADLTQLKGKALGVKAENPSSTLGPATKSFQLRWNEPLGRPECPYVRRWVMTIVGYSFRLHHWVGSDDQRHFHDHAWDFLSVVLFGRYTEIIAHPEGGEDRVVRRAGSWRWYAAEHRHKVLLTSGECWTFVFSKRHRRNFGFYVPGRVALLRPLRYFSRYGLHPCE
jgi:hypothetical protein